MGHDDALRVAAPVEVVELRNGAALNAPAVIELFERAFHGEHFADATEVRRWIAERFDDDALAVLVAVSGSEFVGLALLAAWTSPLEPKPWVAHFYAGRMGVRAPLGAACAAWFRDRGYDAVRTMNFSGASDKAWERVFKRVAPVQRVAAVFDFDLRE